jgi:hypothetical protein
VPQRQWPAGILSGAKGISFPFVIASAAKQSRPDGGRTVAAMLDCIGGVAASQ